LKKKTQLPPLSRPSSKRHEEHTHHEAWAIPYGDLLTLLLAFFVVMYALSSVNEGKYRVLSTSLRVAFQGEAHKPEPAQVGKEPAAAGAAQLSSPAANPAGDAPVPQPASEAAPSASLTPELDNSLANVAGQVESAMADLVQQNLLVVRRTDQGVEVEIKTDILFPSGSAQLAPSAVSVLERLAQVLGPLPNAVRVEGHTDNDGKPEANQKISEDRANAVVKWLVDKGIAAGRLSAVGCAAKDPLVPNDTPEHKQRNRRTEFDVEEMDGKQPPGFTAACKPNPSRKP